MNYLGGLATGNPIFNQTGTKDFVKTHGPKPACGQKPGPQRFGIVLRHDLGPIVKLLRRQGKPVNRAGRAMKSKDRRFQNTNPAQGQIQRAGRKTIAASNFHECLGTVQRYDPINPLADRPPGVIFDDDFARCRLPNRATAQTDQNRQDYQKLPNQMARIPKPRSAPQNNSTRFCHLFHPNSEMPENGPPFTALHGSQNTILGLKCGQNVNPTREVVSNLDTMFLKGEKCLAWP